MAKSLYECANCGYEQPGWFGVCPECGEAEAFEKAEETTRQGKKSASSFSEAKTLKLEEVEQVNYDRDTTGIEELDRVLGGGMVHGSYLILSGEPGAGKTTLASELIINLDKKGKKVLYVSGEESPSQLKMRFERLGSLGKNNINLSNEVSVEKIIKTIESEGYDCVVIDSIQTMLSEQMSGAPGSLAQVRETGSMLMRAAKSTGTTILVIGQVVKSGEIAGPRALEHMVDAVLLFEGDRREQYRILRTAKNRFGSTDEIGVFEMREEGLKGISDPSELFISEGDAELSGAAYTVLIQGSRPVMAEIQALANASNAPQPIRAVRGMDQKRVQMLLAVLQRHCQVRVASYDIYINISGGLKIDDPGTDLAVCLAVASAINESRVPAKTAAFGEVSLLGKCRPAASSSRREKEAKRLGYNALTGNGQLAEIIRDNLKS